MWVVEEPPGGRLFKKGETVIIGFPLVNCEVRVEGYYRGRVTVSMPDGDDDGETRFELSESEVHAMMEAVRSDRFTDRLKPDLGTLVELAEVEARLERRRRQAPAA